ncbi:MAG TPA: hypothetical protein VFM33_12920 [Aquabacterium sp.]|nr:hypothetical protein [Aquabacterium sp.]
MSNEQNNGGPAFPLVEPAGEMCSVSTGMSLRDYFAAKAMQGWIASRPKIMGETLDGSHDMAMVLSKAAYTMADAMLEARK